LTADIVPQAEVARHLAESRWKCIKVKDYAKHALWRTEHGYYFTVPHECSRADFADITTDIEQHGRKRNI